MSRTARRQDEQALLAFMERFDPVTDLRVIQEREKDILRPCGMGCGRTVAVDVAVCVRCRNASSHPALRARVT